MENVRISVFKNVWDKSPRVIGLHEYLEKHVGNDVNGAVQRRYGQLLEEGKKQEAQDLKKSQECAVFGGVCRGGRGERYLTEVSGVAGFDLDHVGGRVDELKEKLRLPFVYAVYTTFSGEGIRVVVNMGTRDVALIRSRYLLVAAFIGRLCGHPCDMQCKDIARASFTSFDPGIWINPGEVEPFPLSERDLREEAVRDVAYGPPPQADGEAGTPAGGTGEEGGMIAGLLHDFMKNNWGGEGNRNNFFIHLGRFAGFRHLSPSELDELIRLTVAELQDDEYGAVQIGGRMKWGYSHAGTAGKKPRNCQTFNSVSYTCADNLEKLYLAETEGVNDGLEPDKLPLIPDRVYEGLPSLLTRGLAAARSDWERDMLFLSMLANLSGCMPYVELNYADKICSTHLYFFAIAKAGSGKGVLALAAQLPRLIQRDFDKDNDRRMAQYRRELAEWEQRRRSKQPAGDDDEPEEPVRKCILQPASTSHSRLVRSIAENPLGVIINSTELDMLTNSLNQDCGHFDDILRAAFHHEEVSIDYKIDKRKIVAYESRVAGSLGGTHGQFIRFVRNEENGMFSRGMYYTVAQKPRWISGKPKKGRLDSGALFRNLSMEVFKMYNFLSGSPTNVLLTDGQWERHDETFTRMLAEVSMEEGSDKEGVVYRLGLIVCRLMAILTALRKYEAGWSMKDVYCSDEDFDRVMSIAEVLLEHGMSLSTIFPEPSVKPKQMNYYFKYRDVLSEVPTVFTRAELLAACLKRNYSESTCDRILSRAKKDMFIEKEGNKYVKKGFAWYKKRYI